MAADSMGSHDGVLHGPTWDKENKAPITGSLASLKFDGVNDYVSVSHNTSLSTNSITLMAWVYISAGTTGDRTIVRKGHWLDREYGLDLVSTRHLRGWVNLGPSGNSAVIVAINTASLPVEQWQHVAMTFDGTTVRLFLDGVLHASTQKTGTQTGYDNVQNVTLGGQLSTSPGGSLPFNGNLDEVAIFSRALEAAEILMAKSQGVAVFLPDTTPPAVQKLTGPDGGEWLNESDLNPTFTWSGLDNRTLPGDLVYSHKLNAGAWSGYSPATSFELTGGLFEGENTFSVRAKDEAGNVSLPVTWTFNVDRVAPVVSDILVNPTPVPLGSTFAVTVSASDLRSGVAAVEYRLNDGGWLPMSGDGPYTASNCLNVAGVHQLEVRARDAAGNVSDNASEMVVVYDPTGGFVTGGGWIDSPVGASVLYPEAVGKASFGFVSRYQRGANIPTGNTQFQFKAGNLNFHSTEYQWLVVTGNNVAQFKGSGTINGEGNYEFMIYAQDGGNRGIDSFRIKIWTYVDGAEIVIYDNQAYTPLGGGSIVVHSK
jgi:hypothetical protein